jgi:hypothetical protein
MQKIVILFICAVFLSSCALTSQTNIGPQKAFELGDGRHGAFTAKVKNVSEVDIEVYQARFGDVEKKLVTLKPGQQKTIQFDADTKAIFKNNSAAKAVVALKVTGDTGLSMGGPNY